MSEVEADDLSLDREVCTSRYAGRDPVTVRTTHLDGEEPSREARILAGLRRLAREGRVIRDLEAELQR